MVGMMSRFVYPINKENNMSNFTLKLEVLAGTDIRTAMLEAKQLAQEVGLAYVCFKFNSKSISIGQDANIDEAYQEYQHTEREFIIYS